MAVWDYSFARPNLAGQGLEGVVRYLAFLPNDKVLTVAERDQIWALGIPILLNWENGAKDMSLGTAVGAQQGAEANRQADALGWPKDRPIVYSADWDANPGDYAAVEGYLRAAAAQGRPAGIYGKNALVHEMMSRGAAAFGWVTSAWQYGQPVTPLAALYQDGLNSPNGTDHNQVLKPDWGQYHPTMGDDMTPEQAKLLQDIHDGMFNRQDSYGGGAPWNLTQILLLVRQIVDEVGKIVAAPPGAVALTNADKDDIAARVLAAMRAKPLAPIA